MQAPVRDGRSCEGAHEPPPEPFPEPPPSHRLATQHQHRGPRSTSNLSITAPFRRGLQSEIVDMAWDPLGANCMVAAYACGVTVMWDVETSSQLSTFQKQPLGIRGMAWLPWAPGLFMTVNNSNCVAKLWNVSQREPLETVRLGGTGVAMSGVAGSWGVGGGGGGGSGGNRIHAIVNVPGNKDKPNDR